MRRKKKNWYFLLLSLLSISALAYFILNYSPEENVSFYFLNFPSLPLFFALVFLFLFFLFSFLFKNIRRGVLIGILIVGLLLLAFYNFTHPFFLISLVVLFSVIELFFSRS